MPNEIGGPIYAEFHLYAGEIAKFISLISAFHGEITASIEYDFSLEKFVCKLVFNFSRDFLIFQNTCCIFSCGKYIS